jgi:superfamily II DNA helicase RecQ
MKKLSLTDVEAGQVVARPVATNSGMVMVQPGTALTADMIARLANLGIDMVWLEGTADDARPVEAVLADLDRRFIGHEDDRLMMELKAVVAACISQGAVDDRD